MVGEIGEGRLGQTEILGQHIVRRVTQPIGDRERAELGEVAVVEHQDERAAVGKPLNGMAVSAREVPDVAGSEIGDLGLVLRVDRGDACVAVDHVGPFGGIGVPVQLAHGARLQGHVDPGQSFGDRELADIGFLRRSAVELLGGGRAERVAERGQL
ncbi:hypothetical protein AUC68_12600 [Methyloceanibacter methanicus]|uniref:Uncharacterized protein n=1 Tax=Methyloceanibacter methanicus TaxID=1774968 RepID=A0A1E3W5U1_9HYPH|nr:hypothetical protein [Methyloceanibacter methanicus]ODS01198.1 hypothetical protein AUC68_12600 [Methyloceanibacter methanicus]